MYAITAAVGICLWGASDPTPQVSMHDLSRFPCRAVVESNLEWASAHQSWCVEVYQKREQELNRMRKECPVGGEGLIPTREADQVWRAWRAWWWTSKKCSDQWEILRQAQLASEAGNESACLEHLRSLQKALGITAYDRGTLPQLFSWSCFREGMPPQQETRSND